MKNLNYFCTNLIFSTLCQWIIIVTLGELQLFPFYSVERRMIQRSQVIQLIGEAYVEGKEGDVWLTGSKELRPSVQQPVRNWILPTST